MNNKARYLGSTTHTPVTTVFGDWYASALEQVFAPVEIPKVGECHSDAETMEWMEQEQGQGINIVNAEEVEIGPYSIYVNRAAPAELLEALLRP